MVFQNLNLLNRHFKTKNKEIFVSSKSCSIRKALANKAVKLLN